MAVTLVGAWTTSSTVTVSKPAGGTAGDIYVLVMHGDSGASPTLAVSGFTAVAASGIDGAEQVHGAWFYRVYDGSEGATFTCTGGTFTLVEFSANIVRGANTGVAPLTSTGTSAAGTASPYTCSGITVVTANTFALMHFSVTVDAPTAAPTSSSWATSYDQPTYHAQQVLTRTFSGTGATGSFSIAVAGYQFGSTGAATAMGLMAFEPTAVGYIHTTITIPSQARFRSVFQ